ncbi:MAG: hypothetical protein IH792_04125 [Thaumarchaeota archaeon]|nr:hypothetical protein [Nitrososphaerota archaeon]
MGKKTILAVIPLIVFVFLTNYDVSAQEIDFECSKNEVVVVRITNPNLICVNESTAHRWVALEIAEIIGETKEKETTGEEIIPEIEESPEETMPEFQYTSIPDDLSRAQSYLVTISGGEFTEPITFQTFSNVEQGDKSHYISSFYDLGLATYFSIESIPSTDKIEFYNLVAKTINPGKPPELFGVSIDVLAGDNSVIVTVNYPKCKITNYTPYSQKLILFYQYSDATNIEIRDRTVLYCSGFNLQVYDEENQKIIPTELLPFTPSEDNVQGYVVHFFGPDFDGLYTVKTFSDFSPSSDLIETPFDVITASGNPFDAKPQFFLESLPSKDKEELYRYFAKWVNPGQPPEFFNVSVDMITENGTILQRWNYIDCSLFDYSMRLMDSRLRFSYTGEQSPEIIDKSDFTCIGRNLEIGGDKPLAKFPIKDRKFFDEEPIISPTIPEPTERAQSFEISIFGGELTQIHHTDKLQKFEPLRRDRGPLTPASQDKQYDFGFVIESLPQKEKVPFYKFISRYINPGKAPEPFDVFIDTINGDGTTLHRLQYVNCDGIDFWWYLQQGTWYYQFSQKKQDEIRERYIFYCEGFRIDFPE